MIKKSDKIRINDKVVSKLLELGFEKSSAESMKRFENTTQIAHTVWHDKVQMYVTVELCCEIPIECCEKITK